MTTAHQLSEPESARRQMTMRSVTVLVAALMLLATGASGQHDCIPYSPTDAGDTIASDWSTLSEQDDYQFTVPDDPGGGYVIASVSSQAPAQPLMRIIPPSGVGVVAQQGTSDPGPSRYELIVAFEVVGGATYDVEIIEDTNAPLDQHPVPYTWTWTFYSRPDCYEPNDGSPGNWPDPIANAREIPFEQVLEASSIAGHLSFAIAAGAEHAYDWYEFTVDVATDISFATVSVPSDQRIRMRLFNSSGTVEVNGVPSPLGGIAVSGPETIQPGTYYLEVNATQRGLDDVTLSEGDALPAHFVSDYAFVVSEQPIPSCGFQAIFCDGFESGDSTFWSSSSP